MGEQPTITIKTVQKKTHPAVHTQTMLKGHIHKATWKTLHTAPYLASIATIAAKAMHECAPHTPYEIMSKGSGTPEATMITQQIEQIHSNDSQEEKRQYLKLMKPLNPYTKQGCPLCEQNDIFADAKHYTMGHCKHASKHMVTNFGRRIAAWIICHSCPGTWIHNDAKENKLEETTQMLPEECSTPKQNPFMPQKVVLHKPKQQTTEEVDKETNIQKDTHIPPTQQNNTNKTNPKKETQPMDDTDFFMMDAEEGISDEDQLEDEEEDISIIYTQMIYNETTAQIKEHQENKNTVAASTINKLMERVQQKYQNKTSM